MVIICISSEWKPGEKPEKKTERFDRSLKDQKEAILE
jgi:hypothetical protein